ncbi:hypothetical protein FH972_021237 [Carpinus fangiana]|uniref:Uncharacterized protein n=1 Tax=Carpinus fangiana TaxID=176857 RepID=A0A5N6KNR9_9ROSI|nr:hypothetical protein FH972_021237 [Carpinus fangiana]
MGNAARGMGVVMEFGDGVVESDVLVVGVEVVVTLGREEVSVGGAWVGLGIGVDDGDELNRVLMVESEEEIREDAKVVLSRRVVDATTVPSSYG